MVSNILLSTIAAAYVHNLDPNAKQTEVFVYSGNSRRYDVTIREY